MKNSKLRSYESVAYSYTLKRFWENEQFSKGFNPLGNCSTQEICSSDNLQAWVKAIINYSRQLLLQKGLVLYFSCAITCDYELYLE